MNFLSMKSVKLNKKIGFTLAEVLITLAVIGVVAALTIPTLAKNYQNAQYLSALKKAYTQMNQVFLRMAVDSGQSDSISSYFVYTGNSADSQNQSGDAIAKYYNLAKNCRSASSALGCVATYNNNIDGTSSSNTAFDNRSDYYKFLTKDGMSFSFGLMSASSGNHSCNYHVVPDPNSPLYNVCGWVIIDVNGFKKPNFMGRDVFMFEITSNKIPMLYPEGSKDRDYWNEGGRDYCSLKSTNFAKSGTYCTGRLMEKGWVMDY